MKNKIRFGLQAAIVVWVGVSFGVKQASAGSDLPVLGIKGKAIETSSTVVAAVIHRSGPPLPDDPDWQESIKPRPIIMLYEDGTLVWAKEPVKARPPLYRAQVNKADVQKFLKYIQQKGYLGNKALNTSYFGPDSPTRIVYVRSGNECLRMESWHEGWAPGIVVTSRGAAPLNGRDPDAVLEEDKKEYQDFRAAWDDVRKKLEELKPKGEMKPVEGLGVMR